MAELRAREPLSFLQVCELVAAGKTDCMFRTPETDTRYATFRQTCTGKWTSHAAFLLHTIFGLHGAPYSSETLPSAAGDGPARAVQNHDDLGHGEPGHGDPGHGPSDGHGDGADAGPSDGHGDGSDARPSDGRGDGSDTRPSDGYCDGADTGPSDGYCDGAATGPSDGRNTATAPCARRTQGDVHVAVTRNDFPYSFAPDVHHFVLWKFQVGTPACQVSDEELQWALDCLRDTHQLREHVEWVTPPALRSVPGIAHVHIAFRSAS